MLPGTVELFFDIRLTLSFDLEGVSNSLGFLDIVDTSLLILSNLSRNSLRVEIDQLDEAKRSFSPTSVNLGQKVGISGIRFKLIFKSSPTPDKVKGRTKVAALNSNKNSRVKLMIALVRQK